MEQLNLVHATLHLVSWIVVRWLLHALPLPNSPPQICTPTSSSPKSQPPASATVTYIYSQTPSMERSLNYFFIGHIVLFMSDLSRMRRGLSAQPLPIPTSVTVTAHRPPLPLRRTDVRQSGLRPSCSFVLSHVPLLWAAEVRWQCSGSDAPLPPPPGSLRQ